jgi:hypothetical protein
MSPVGLRQVMAHSLILLWPYTGFHLLEMQPLRQHCIRPDVVLTSIADSTDGTVRRGRKAPSSLRESHHGIQCVSCAVGHSA